MRAFIHYSKFFTTRVVDELHALQQLEISYTHIGEVTFRDVLRALHKGIGGWYHLKTLGVAQCDLGEYAVELLSRDVREIDSGDEIALEEINFSSNKLQDETIFLLSTCLALCTQLKRLDLRHNSITKRSIAEVASSLSKASGLRVLHVRSNRIGDEGLADLLRYVVHWPALEELDLTRCRLTCRSLPALSEALPQLSSLKVLNLSGNDLRLVQEMKDDIPVGDLKLFVHDPAYLKGGSGKVPTSFALDRRDREAGRVRYKGPTVEELEGEKPSSAKVNVFAHFGEALSSCRSLEVLDLSDTVLEDGSFTNLAQTLTLPKLRELRLGSNPLFAGAQTSLDHLVSLLWSSNELEVLDLAFTGIGDLGLTVLCDGTSEGCEGVLGSLHQLRILHLSHCRANKLGLESLCARLGDFSKLERLAYDGNCSPNEGLEELLGRAAALASLEFLGLTGCTPLREGLRSCEAYRTLREKGVVILV
ncbi:Leucine Rich repeat/Leucine Rich Repeat, putative [Angomonas deanei]|uniref:Leucine Rich repeat/Leucine Rich Repeat, putative n=1 Tax=Angomonas deanei TaxID=59799 RepID=A0A7G2CQW0_9TRYP|nr:Leucine Rich repeat/Leucine Rich Repeat, putative [Angomonas deanei]